MTSPPVMTAGDASTEALRSAVPKPFQILVLPQVAEEVAARGDMLDSHKARILLAIVRGLAALQPPSISNVGDVDRLALENPGEFERLRRGYWFLLGARSARYDSTR